MSPFGALFVGNKTFTTSVGNSKGSVLEELLEGITKFIVPTLTILGNFKLVHALFGANEGLIEAFQKAHYRADWYTQKWGYGSHLINYLEEIRLLGAPGAILVPTVTERLEKLEAMENWDSRRASKQLGNEQWVDELG